MGTEHLLQTKSGTQLERKFMNTVVEQGGQRTFQSPFLFASVSLVQN